MELPEIYVDRTNLERYVLFTVNICLRAWSGLKPDTIWMHEEAECICKCSDNTNGDMHDLDLLINSHYNLHVAYLIRSWWREKSIQIRYAYDITCNWWLYNGMTITSSNGDVVVVGTQYLSCLYHSLVGLGTYDSPCHGFSHPLPSL